MVTLLAAGHETIATALTWSLYLLAHHPAIQEQACLEIDDVLQGRKAGANDVKSLTFTRMVLAERCGSILLCGRLPGALCATSSLGDT